MALVRFILNPIAKKSYQVLISLVHEVVLFVFLPLEDALYYTALTTGLYSVYFGLMILFSVLRYYDRTPRDRESLYFTLERVLILK